MRLTSSSEKQGGGETSAEADQDQQDQADQRPGGPETRRTRDQADQGGGETRAEADQDQQDQADQRPGGPTSLVLVTEQNGMSHPLGPFRGNAGVTFGPKVSRQIIKVTKQKS